jgi:hypothetical protein
MIRITDLNKFSLASAKLNDRSTDIPFGEVGDDMSLPILQQTTQRRKVLPVRV